MGIDAKCSGICCIKLMQLFSKPNLVVHAPRQSWAMGWNIKLNY